VADRLLDVFSSVRVAVGIWLLAVPLFAAALAISGGEAAVAKDAVAASKDAPARKVASIEIAWVGDITPGSQYGLPPDAGRGLFARVRKRLRAPDLTLGNLEGTLSVGGQSKCLPSSEDCFSFQAPPENAAAFAWAGFDAVNLANNHANDYGLDGQAQTVAALEGVDVATTGRPGEITVVRRNGIDVALVGFAPYPWANDNRDLLVVQQVVADAGEAADVVVVLAHLGSEGSDQTQVPLGREVLGGEDRGDSRLFAHAAIDAGADAVLASGPHVLRGIERYADRPIAYSLGNFAGYRNFATSGDLALSGILKLRLTADGTTVAGRLASVRLDSAGVPAPDATGAAAAMVSGLGVLNFGAGAVGIAPDGGLDW
jgi:hypothetical protein